MAWASFRKSKLSVGLPKRWRGPIAYIHISGSSTNEALVSSLAVLPNSMAPVRGEQCALDSNSIKADLLTVTWFPRQPRSPMLSRGGTTSLCLHENYRHHYPRLAHALQGALSTCQRQSDNAACELAACACDKMCCRYSADVERRSSQIVGPRSYPRGSMSLWEYYRSFKSIKLTGRAKPGVVLMPH